MYGGNTEKGPWARMRSVREGFLEEVLTNLSLEWLAEVFQVQMCKWREGGNNIGKEEGKEPQGIDLHNSLMTSSKNKRFGMTEA